MNSDVFIIYIKFNIKNIELYTTLSILLQKDICVE